jgi:hypothetical protein
MAKTVINRIPQPKDVIAYDHQYDPVLKVWRYSPVIPVPKVTEETNTNTATKDTASSEEPLRGIVYDMSKPSYRSQYGRDVCTKCKAAIPLGYDQTTCRYYRTAKYRKDCYWLRFGFMCDLVLTEDQKPLND